MTRSLKDSLNYNGVYSAPHINLKEFRNFFKIAAHLETLPIGSRPSLMELNH